ncbi:MAG: NUDIX hydrolase [Pseudomonadota bacterium]
MIYPLDQTKLILSDEPLPFMVGQRDEIDRYWNGSLHRNNRLWNGDFFLFTDVKIVDRVIHGLGHKTDFSTFLYWRDHGRDQCVTHITGTTFPHFDDGSLLAIKMADHTANAGRVYFPAGALDGDDIVDGAFDIGTNIRRELMEEIGLDMQDEWLSGPLLASADDNAFHITQTMRIPIGYEQLENDWKLHRANGGDDEVECLVPICHPDDIPLEMPTYAAALCRYHFDKLERR